MKSRDMMISWACVAYLTWKAMTVPLCGSVVQTQKEKKAIQLVEYAKCLYRRQPAWLGDAIPLAKPLKQQSELELQFANGSYIVGIPGGADQIRSYHPWGYLNDESSFQPEAGDCYNEALSVVKGQDHLQLQRRARLVRRCTTGHRAERRRMKRAEEALRKSKAGRPQNKIEIVRGMQVHRTKGGIPVLSIHYSADPERDPQIHPEWKQSERRTYSSQAAWDREQEMVDEAGGGELVFADTLITYWNKIVITDPSWRPSPHWRVEGGFDHGKTNPTVLLRAYIDGDGVIYFCGEYYMPGKEVWEHVPEIRKMPDIGRLSACYADPTIFDCTMQQSISPLDTPSLRQSAKSINVLYQEQGLDLFGPFSGDRSDVGFAARLMLHWSNLDRREPTVRIVCRNRSEQPQYGLHPWDCPNLLWELLRCRREKLSAQQLLSRNSSERIVDKDNHARDAMKYVLMSWPEPSVTNPREQRQEEVKRLIEIGDPTSAMIRYQQYKAESQPCESRIYLGRYRRRYRR